MRKKQNILSLGGLLVALLFIGLLACREANRLIPVTFFEKLEKIADSNKGQSPSCIDIPTQTQPFLLQQPHPLSIGNGEVRQHNPTPTGLQEHHIKLFHTFYKTLHAEHTVRQTHRHTDGYFFYMLCQMLI